MRKSGELIDVGINAAYESVKLRENFCYISGDFRQRARKNVVIIIAIHLEFSELGVIVEAGGGLR